MDLFGRKKRNKYDITSYPHMKPIYYAGDDMRTKYNNYTSPNAVVSQSNEVPTKYNHVYSNMYEDKVPTKYNHYVADNPALDLRPEAGVSNTVSNDGGYNLLGRIGNLFRRNVSSNDNSGNVSVRKKDKSVDTGSYIDPYKFNVFVNSLLSGARHAPTIDSVMQYNKKLKDTPNLSSFKNAVNEAEKPTSVMRQSASHVAGNYKSNRYDYTEAANKTQAQAAATKNLLARRASGNLAHLSPYTESADIKSISMSGTGYLDFLKTNEEREMNAYKLNQASDQFNAQADNQADASYINARNSAAMQDHNNRIAALNNYASNEYNINHTYQKELDEKRDSMIKNIANEGLNAYNNNKTNTNKKNNYWYDNNGVMHFIDGERPVEAPERQQINISDEMIDKFEHGANDEQKNMLTSLINQYGGNKAVARQVWANYLINSAKTR